MTISAPQIGSADMIFSSTGYANAQSSEPEIAERRVIVRAAAERPVVFAIGFLDRGVIDAGDSQPHQAMLVKFPVFVAVAAEPVAAVVVRFVGESHRDAILVEGPNLLDQAVIELAVPFTPQERLDRLAPFDELRAVPPAACGRIRERDARRVPR